MSSKVVLSMSILIAYASPALLHAAEDPTNSTLLKQCESAKGEVKRECKEVATEMMKHPDAHEERNDKTGQDVTHSSPVMENDSKPAKPTPPKQDAKQDAKKDANKDAIKETNKVEPKQ